MKTLLLVIMCFAALNVSAQQNSPIYTIGSAEIIDSVSIPITVENFDGVYGFQLRLEYDPAVIECYNVVFNTDIPKLFGYHVGTDDNNMNDYAGMTRIAGIWMPPYIPVTLDDGTELLTVYFVRTGNGGSEITFNDGFYNGVDGDTYCITTNPASNYMSDTPYENHYKGGMIITVGFSMPDECDAYRQFYEYFNQ